MDICNVACISIRHHPWSTLTVDEHIDISNCPLNACSLHTLNQLQASTISKQPMALNLVDYSDSDSQSDNPPKRVCTSCLSPTTQPALGPSSPTELPPLPSRFHDLYVAAPRLAARDDPSLHGGRQRAVPHEVGNWPTFVFLECRYCS